MEAQVPVRVRLRLRLRCLQQPRRTRRHRPLQLLLPGLQTLQLLKRRLSLPRRAALLRPPRMLPLQLTRQAEGRRHKLTARPTEGLLLVPRPQSLRSGPCVADGMQISTKQSLSVSCGCAWPSPFLHWIYLECV